MKPRPSNSRPSDRNDTTQNSPRTTPATKRATATSTQGATRAAAATTQVIPRASSLTIPPTPAPSSTTTTTTSKAKGTPSQTTAKPAAPPPPTRQPPGAAAEVRGSGAPLGAPLLPADPCSATLSSCGTSDSAISLSLNFDDYDDAGLDGSDDEEEEGSGGGGSGAVWPSLKQIRIGVASTNEPAAFGGAAGGGGGGATLEADTKHERQRGSSHSGDAVASSVPCPRVDNDPDSTLRDYSGLRVEEQRRPMQQSSGTPGNDSMARFTTTNQSDQASANRQVLQQHQEVQQQQSLGLGPGLTSPTSESDDNQFAECSEFDDTDPVLATKSNGNKTMKD
ncbi:hypothetical protein Pelo_8823 [Pelomyxa schiedti]|nr:hypothetical protein Pelo_8823 [Pelomyxa schiedti]